MIKDPTVVSSNNNNHGLLKTVETDEEEEGSTFPVEEDEEPIHPDDEYNIDRRNNNNHPHHHDGTSLPLNGNNQYEQQQQQQQYEELMTDNTIQSLSTQIAELVEREVGKLTRQSRMLLEEVGEEVKPSQQQQQQMKSPTPHGSDRVVGEVVDHEESKYNEDADVDPNIQANGEKSPSSNDVPLLDRSEIMAGTLLGNGAFSEVYQIWGFRLQDQDWQREAREKLARTAMSEMGNCAYVLKHLRNELTHDKNRFVHAASDLVLEALFLSKFDHENIIKLRGTSRGIDTFDNVQHDGFFLILDRLDCTLSDKIGQWARHASCRRKVYSHNLWDYMEKIDLSLQIARGLDYLHDRDVLYRDLKPDNIGIQTVDGRHVVKIFDFGLCRELPEECPVDTKVFHMSGVGTRRYSKYIFVQHGV
jgi:Protein kinase domain